MSIVRVAVAYALILDPKDENQGEGFPQSRPGWAVEDPLLRIIPGVPALRRPAQRHVAQDIGAAKLARAGG
jgi:hypothetical protein